MKKSRSFHDNSTPLTLHAAGDKVGCASELYGFGAREIDEPMVSFDYVTDTGAAEPIFVTEALARKISQAFRGKRPR